jgi:hypothetical protein
MEYVPVNVKARVAFPAARMGQLIEVLKKNHDTYLARERGGKKSEEEA